MYIFKYISFVEFGQWRRFFCAICLFFIATVALLAQPRGRVRIVAEGTVVDSKTYEPLVGAAVKVTSADGNIGTFGICDSIGHFTFEVNRAGKYTLEVTYVGYKPLTKDANLFPGRGAKLGTLKLQEDPKLLSEVETVARDQRIKQVDDTIMYNAEAYKVADGATAEELVAKMPGIEVTDEGIKAQGETVEKLLVDGKSFFENDPRMALRTLPAEVVQTVAVFDKKSDQAEFTGFDDGNTVRAMDLRTKSWRRNGTFGTVYGSAGSTLELDRAYWNVGLNLNNFSGDRRISMQLMANNVNQQNFSFDDLQASGGRGGGGGGRMGNRVGAQSGVTRANAFGLNYNNTFLDNKLEVQGHYTFKQTRTQSNDSTFSDNINTPRSSISQNERLSHNYSHGFDMNITYKPTARDQFVFRPSVNLQLADALSASRSVTWKMALDTVMSHPDIRGDQSRWQNSSQNSSETNSTSWNVGGSLLWRHRFNAPGRTLSVNVNAQLSASESEGEYVKNVNRRGDYFQRQLSDQHNFNYGGNAQWTERLGERQQLSLRYNFRYQRSANDRNISFYEEDDFAELKTDTLQGGYDAKNTNEYRQMTMRNSGEVAWRMRTDHWNMNLNLDFESSHQEGQHDYYLRPELNDPLVSKTYYSLLPSARIEWRSEGGTQLQFDYRSSSSNPSVSQLQQSVNTGNELHYSTGNPELDQNVRHNVGLRFIHTNRELATNYMVYGEYSVTLDHIGTQYLTNNSSQVVSLPEIGSRYGYDTDQFAGLQLIAGARISRPINVGSSRSARLSASYGFPFDLIYSNMNLSVDGSYSTSPTQQLYYDIDQQTGLGVMTDLSANVVQWNLSPRVNVTSNVSPDVDFTIGYQPSFRWVDDPRNAANSRNYINHRASARLNWTFWNGFTTEQSVNFSHYGGSAMTEAKTDYVWNMSLGKKFLRANAAQIKLQVFDVLSTRSGYNQSVNDTSVRSTYQNYMPRYFLLTFSYKISNYKGSVATGDESRRGGRRGGGSGGGPGGGFGGRGGRF